MLGINEWNAAAGMTQQLLTSLITAAFDGAVSSGRIENPLTIVDVSNQTVAVELSHPDLQIAPNPDPGTGWADGVVLGCDLHTDTDPPLSGRLSVKWNLATLSAGSVIQTTFVNAGGQAGSYADCGTLPGSLPGAATLMCWVNLDSSSAQTLLSLVDTSGTLRMSLTVNQNQPSLSYWGQSYTYTPAYASDGTYYPDVTPGHWHQLGAVIGPSAQVAFYIDGQLQRTVPLDGLQPFSGGLMVGTGGATATLSGKITGVSVWPAALSPAQVTQLMNADPSAGGLPSGLSCLGYWVFDPASPTNLMKPGSAPARFFGAAAPQEDANPVTETYLYFSSVEPADVVQVSNTLPDQWPDGWDAPPDTNPQQLLDDAVSTPLETAVMKGAISLGESASDASSATPTLIQFITETAQSGDQGDWPGPDELLMLVTMNHGVPPDLDAKAAFAGDTAMQVPATANLVFGLSDEFLFGLLAAQAEANGDHATVGTDPVALTITKDPTRLTLDIVNGKGIGIALHTQIGVLSRDVWNLDISLVLGVTVVTSDGKKYKQMSLSDVDVSVLANQSSATVISFEVSTALLTLVMPELAALCLALAMTWQAFLYFKIWDALTSKTFDPTSVSDTGRFELVQIAFEDGVLVYGFLNAQGPTITALSASSGSPGDAVTISGTSFVDSQGASLISEVWIGGQSAEWSGVDGGTSANASLVALVPLGGTGVPTPVKVRNTSSLWSNLFGSFTVLGTVAPGSVSVVDTEGVTGDSIRVSGQGFTGTTGVQIGGKDAAGFTVVGDTSLTAVVPSVPQAGPVAVTNNVGVGASTNTFEPIGPPIVTGADPAFGKPGDPIGITGTGFIVRGDQPVQVFFSRDPDGKFKTDGVDAKGDEEQVTAVVPLGAVPAYLWVETVAGTSGPLSFRVDSLGPPTVADDFSPAYGTTLDQIQVAGTNFSGAASVQIGSQTCSFVLDADEGDTLMMVTVAKNTTTGPITVRNSAGNASSTRSFEIIAKPTISSVSPLTGTPGTEVTIKGTGFVNAQNQSVVEQVLMSGQSATVPSGSVTTLGLVAIVPPGTTGVPTPVEVDTAGGKSTSVQKFTVSSTAPPSILTFSPPSGAGGSTVTVDGTNFTGTTQVTIGAACVFAVVSDTKLSVTVSRSQATGSYPIVVQNSLGSTSSSDPFQVTA